jgi:hypothetical protein
MLRKYLGMKFGIILFGVWLLLSGLLPLLGVQISGSGTVLALLAVAAGVLNLLGISRQDWIKEKAMLLLGIWLLAIGLIGLLDLSFSNSDTFLSILAVAAGGLLLLELRDKVFSEELGWIAAGAWLVLWGLIPLLGLRFDSGEMVLNVLAVVAGALILLGR